MELLLHIFGSGNVLKNTDYSEEKIAKSNFI